MSYERGIRPMVHHLLVNYRVEISIRKDTTCQKTHIAKQLSIMKAPPSLIVRPRSTMERAIIHQARSTRRSPSISPVRHTKHRRRLTKNLYNRSNLQLE